MGIENLLLCGIFFNPGDDIPLYGDAELIQRAKSYNKANAVGNSHFQTWLADPQPNPALTVYNKNGGFSSMQDTQGVTSFTKNSIGYSNGAGTLGGITNLSFAEVCTLLSKHFGGKK